MKNEAMLRWLAFLFVASAARDGKPLAAASYVSGMGWAGSVIAGE